MVVLARGEARAGVLGVPAAAAASRLRGDRHDLVKLEAHLEDDHLRGAADREHGERREQEREHRTEKKSGDDDRLAEGNTRRRVNAGAVDVRRNEAGRGEDRGADGEALAGSRSRVPERVERVGHVAHVLGNLRLEEKGGLGVNHVDHLLDRLDEILNVTGASTLGAEGADRKKIGAERRNDVAVALDRRRNRREAAADRAAETFRELEGLGDEVGAGGGVNGHVFRLERIREFGELGEDLAEGELTAHLGETAGVVRDRAVRISGERDAEGGKHADRGNGDTVERRALVADDDGNDDGDARNDARDHANAEALDDDGGRGHETLLRDGDDGVVERRAVLSPRADRDARDEADDDAEPDPEREEPVERAEEHDAAPEGASDRKDGRDRDADTKRPEEALAEGLLRDHLVLVVRAVTRCDENLVILRRLGLPAHVERLIGARNSVRPELNVGVLVAGGVHHRVMLDSFLPRLRLHHVRANDLRGPLVLGVDRRREARPRARAENTDDGADDAAASDPERKGLRVVLPRLDSDRRGARVAEHFSERVQLLELVQVVPEGGGGDDGADVGLEEVGAHAGDVTDVVTNVVRDHGRVVRGVLVEASLDLADEISAAISGLRVNAAADAREERDRGAAGTEAGHVVPHVIAGDEREDAVEDRDAEQAERDHGERHDRTGRERDREAVLEAVGRVVGRDSGARVRLGRDEHARETGSRGERRADDEADRGPDTCGVLLPRELVAHSARIVERALVPFEVRVDAPLPLRGGRRRP